MGFLASSRVWAKSWSLIGILSRDQGSSPTLASSSENAAPHRSLGSAKGDSDGALQTVTTSHTTFDAVVAYRNDPTDKP